MPLHLVQHPTEAPPPLLSPPRLAHAPAASEASETASETAGARLDAQLRAREARAREATIEAAAASAAASYALSAAASAATSYAATHATMHRKPASKSAAANGGRVASTPVASPSRLVTSPSRSATSPSRLATSPKAGLRAPSTPPAPPDAERDAAGLLWLLQEQDEWLQSAALQDARAAAPRAVLLPADDTEAVAPPAPPGENLKFGKYLLAPGVAPGVAKRVPRRSPVGEEAVVGLSGLTSDRGLGSGGGLGFGSGGMSVGSGGGLGLGSGGMSVGSGGGLGFGGAGSMSLADNHFASPSISPSTSPSSHTTQRLSQPPYVQPAFEPYGGLAATAAVWSRAHTAAKRGRTPPRRDDVVRALAAAAPRRSPSEVRRRDRIEVGLSGSTRGCSAPAVVRSPL